MFKKVSAAAVLCAAVMMAAGCSGKTASTGSGGVLSDVQKFVEADGRDYGKSFTAEIGEEQKNTFFSLTVDKAVRLSTLAGYLPDDGFDYLAVSVSVKNISDKVIPMGTADFVIRWADGDDGRDIPYSLEGEDNSYGFTDYPDSFELTTTGSNSKLSGWLYFAVPKDAMDIKLEYLEVYNDEFEGSTYQVNLGNPSFYENDIAFSESYLSGNVGDTLNTPNFDLTLNSLTTPASVEGCTPDEGYSFLAADFTLKNTTSEDLTVYATNFFVLGSDDYLDYSVEATEENGFTADGYFPEEVTLGAGESVSGTVLFVPSNDVSGLSVAFVKTYDDGSYDMYEFFDSGSASV